MNNSEADVTVPTIQHPDQTDIIQEQLVSDSANLRQEKHFRSAQNHSLMVKLLKGGLPVLAAGLVLGFATVSYLNTGPVGDISVESTGITNGKLIMESPRVKGYNEQNQPYDLNAVRAIQDLKKPDIVTLETIDAILPAQDGNYAKIDANTGVYNSAKEWLSLNKDITINRKDGTVITLDSAEIDLKKGNLVSRKPVKVLTSTSKISADEVEVIDNGAIVIFKKRVQMTIKPSENSN